MNQKVAGNDILKENKKNWIEISVFAALVAIASAVTFWLFYRQCVESMQGTGLYHSDMKAYILEMQGLDSGYSFPYPVLFKLAATIHLVTASFTGGAELAMALATMLLNSGAMIALKVMLDKHVGAKLQEAMPGKPWLPGILTGTAAVSLFFVSMVYPPTGIYLPGIKYKYLGVLRIFARQVVFQQHLVQKSFYHRAGLGVQDHLAGTLQRLLYFGRVATHHTGEYI